MATATPADATQSATPAQVDPRAPRFGQGVTATLLAIGLGLQRPVFVYVVAAILGVAAVSHWRLDVYAVLWRRLLQPVVEPATEADAAAPHRFAKLVGAAFTVTASGLLMAGVSIVGYALAAIVMVLAGIAAVFDLCVGCRLYREVAFFQRLGWV